MGIPTADPTSHERDTARARRRAGLVAAVAGLGLLPWFVLVDAVATFEGVEPPLGGRGEEFVAFYVANYSIVPWRVTLSVVQWVIVLVLLVAIVRAVCVRLDLAAILAVTMAGAATAIYVTAEGVLLWPALPAADLSAETLGDRLDPGLAQAALLSRDGLHAPAAILLGICVLVIAWLLASSDLWGRWVMATLGAIAGAFALSSVLVGPEGLGPGLIFVLWAPVVAVILLVGRRLERRRRSVPPT